MDVKPIEIHPAALSELKSAIAWYMEQSEPAAFNFSSELDQAIAFISASPQRWPSGGHNTRKFVLRHFPYAIFYREHKTAIQIVAVAHGSRRPEYWKHRL